LTPRPTWISIALIGPLVTWRFRLPGNKNLSLAPSMHWPEPVMMIDTEASEGPAITLVEFRIDPKTAAEFLKAMKEMRRIRQRDGAIRWNLLRDTADPQRYIESFVTESWADPLAPARKSVTCRYQARRSLL